MHRRTPTFKHNTLSTRVRSKLIRDNPFNRRVALLQEIAREFLPEAFLPEEAGAILFGSLESARRAVRNVRRRLLMNRTGRDFLKARPTPCDPSTAPPRPVHVLSWLNCGQVFPPLLPPEIKIGTLGFTGILSLVREQSALRAPAHHLLDLLATASGLSWIASSGLLVAHKIISRPMDKEDIVVTAAARTFWTLYGEGRLRYGALVAGKEAPAWYGDWAFFDRRQLEALLPGIILPAQWCRREYLTSYLRKEECALDVYSLTGLPLFTHPFPAKFNPLTFGKPRQLVLKA